MSLLSRRKALQITGAVTIRGGARISYNRLPYQDSAVIIGQSLAAGGGTGTSAISTTQPFTNLMFAGGVLRPASLGSYSLLVEGTGNGVNRETIASGFANQVAAYQRAAIAGSVDRDLLMHDWATDGQCYSVLKKGGTGSNYADSITAVTTSAATPPNGRRLVRVRAMLCVHGECDASNVNYAANLAEWQSDYQTDIQAATGQTDGVPMFVSEWQPAKLNNIYGAYLADPTRIVLVGPKYFLEHSDSLHLVSSQYTILGEYYAKAYWQHVIQGTQWHPLRPTSVSRSGAVITLVYGAQGRVGDLVFDTTAVTALADGNYGFEYTDSATGLIHVQSVAITDAANGVVQVTLTGNPGAGGFFTYGASGSGGGPVTGTRGNLRDSDPAVGRSGAHLYNWATNWTIASGTV